jgi:membrane associated rhomboid family serine protease
MRRLSLTVERPYVTIALVLVPAAILVVARAADISLVDLGLVVGTPASANPWWHYLVSPFLYNDIGYLFAIGVGMVLFVPGLERRLGMIPTALLLVAAGALGALVAPGLDDAFGDGFTLTAGGNGIALAAVGASFMVRRADARDDPTEELDMIPIVVAAMVLLALPLVNDYANEWSGIVGGLVGLAAGFSATLGRR